MTSTKWLPSSAISETCNVDVSDAIPSTARHRKNRPYDRYQSVTASGRQSFNAADQILKTVGAVVKVFLVIMTHLIWHKVAVCWSLLHLFITIAACHRKDRSSERRLFEYLMKNYDPASRPVMNADDTVKVNFSISLNKIHDLVEKNQTLITHVWIFEEWIDEILRWNPRRFDGLTSIVIPTRLVWLPDVYIFNNADKGSEGFVASLDSHVIVEHTGRISWTTPLIIKSSCSVDVRYFPFDNQHCFVKFGSWIYEESQLDLILKDDVVDLSPPFSENTELDLRSATLNRTLISYDLTRGRYPQITMYISVRRRPVFYAYTVIAPTLVLCILTLFSFLLPCDNGDKVGIGLTVFLSLYVLQLAIAENVPEANSLPLVGDDDRCDVSDDGVAHGAAAGGTCGAEDDRCDDDDDDDDDGLFLTLVMTLNAISLVFATLVINIKKKGDRLNCPCVPDLVLKFCRMILAKITCTPFINFYEFYGFCELEKEAMRKALPVTGETETTLRRPIDGGASSTGGMATFRPKAKLSAAGKTRLEKRRRARSQARAGDDGGETSLDELVPSRDNPPRDPKYEWFFVAEVLDKSLFLLFLIAMVFTIVISLIVVPWMHRND
ncbi:hypothetical protein LSH36_768g01001 [Paralvinella palmiformis]|uniref:Uncharacterized protein n=1 Tax=Paralvinella palmiformis TaxID=53620 RepID=A0AAD9J118_9ANNE|nr:hypothetical protein LSH36_768g01001 [Paralvinella palmiformis]